jgi:hypothetical protein
MISQVSVLSQNGTNASVGVDARVLTGKITCEQKRRDLEGCSGPLLPILPVQ